MYCRTVCGVVDDAAAAGLVVVVLGSAGVVNCLVTCTVWLARKVIVMVCPTLKKNEERRTRTKHNNNIMINITGG